MLDAPPPIETVLTQMLGVRYPIIVAPMFLASNVDMVVATGEAGALGAIPSLNFRTTDALRSALAEIKSRTTAPFGVNLIIKGPRGVDDLSACLEARVPLLITSMGDPTPVIKAAHEVGSRVFCDVVNVKHARKVEAAGADAVVAVSVGAGGHAGRISPFVLVPWLRREIKLPVALAGGIANGDSVAAALALGAEMAYVGTRFVASTEASASPEHKDMILRATPEDIEFTPEVTGHPANFLTESLGAFRAGAKGSAWNSVWSAGQSAGLVTEIKTCAEIIHELVRGYTARLAELPRPRA